MPDFPAVAYESPLLNPEHPETLDGVSNVLDFIRGPGKYLLLGLGGLLILCLGCLCRRCCSRRKEGSVLPPPLSPLSSEERPPWVSKDDMEAK